MIKFLCAFFLISLSFQQASFAQTLEEQRLQSGTKFNYLSDLTLDTNVQRANTVDNISGGTYTFGLKYAPDKKTNLWAFVRGAKRFNGEQVFGLLDTILRYERLIPKYQGFTNRFRASAILPTNEDIHESTSFNGGLSLQLRSGRPLGKKVYFNFINSLRWNTHEFTVSEQAVANIEAVASTLASFAYSLNAKFLFASSVGASVAKTYRNKTRNNYSFDVAAVYNYTNRTSFTAGYAVNGAQVKADGRSSNIRLFDERNSNYFLSLTYFY